MLVDLKKDDLFPSQSEIDKIEEIIQALGYVECCSRMLCQRDCSLSEADRVLEFLVNKLRTLESEFAKRNRRRVTQMSQRRSLRHCSNLNLNQSHPNEAPQMSCEKIWTPKYQ